MPAVAIVAAKILVGLRLVCELQRLGIPDELLLGETVDDRTHQDALGQVAGVFKRRGGGAFSETGVPVDGYMIGRQLLVQGTAHIAQPQTGHH